VSGIPPVVGYVPDRFPAGDGLSAIAYLKHMGRIRGLSTTQATKQATALLGRLELAGGMGTPIRELSKGNAQKVALAQALMVQPNLLVLDEPWSGLDSSAHGLLGDIIAELVGAGGSVVFTDHRESIIRTHAGRTFTIEAGRLRAQAWTRPDDGPTARVVLREPDERARPHEVDWYEAPGVLRVTPTAESILVHVAGDACDGLLLFALRNGWSVVEVQRESEVVKAAGAPGRTEWSH
jgi:ABC-type multidrug transport system ATPase subunit